MHGTPVAEFFFGPLGFLTQYTMYIFGFVQRQGLHPNSFPAVLGPSSVESLRAECMLQSRVHILYAACEQTSPLNERKAGHTLFSNAQASEHPRKGTHRQDARQLAAPRDIFLHKSWPCSELTIHCQPALPTCIASFLLVVLPISFSPAT